MARRKIEFTEDQKSLMISMVTGGKTHSQIVEALDSVFGLKVGEETIRRKIKELGIKKEDGRQGVEFTSEEKSYIEISYNLGQSLRDICDGLKKEYNKDVSHTTIDKLIKVEGYMKGERIEFEWDDDDDDDYIDWDKIVEKKNDEMSKIPQETLEKMAKDPNLIRLNWYKNGEPYNYEGNGVREGMKDTWFTRDGFPKINLTNAIYFSKDYTYYETCGGEYRTQWLLDSDAKFYMFVEGEDPRGYEQTNKRLDIRRWYIDHKDKINKLYDKIVEMKFAAGIPEITEFNELCKKLYEFKIEFAEVLHGEDAVIPRLMRGETKDVCINDIAGWTKEGNVSSEFNALMEKTKKETQKKLKQDPKYIDKEYGF